MPPYKPGQGISGSALDRLKARKITEAGVADIPAEDTCEQWDKLLGVAAKKKLRCGVCTRPLSELDQHEKRIVCEACERGPSTATGVNEPNRVSLEAQEFGRDVFYASYRAAALAQTSKAFEAPAPKTADVQTADVGGASKSSRSTPNTNERCVTLSRSAPIRDSTALVPKGRTALSVISFNLLADCYVRVEGQPWNAFAYCEDSVLAWEKRKPQIIDMLLTLAPDVICVQELVMERRMQPGAQEEEWAPPAWTEQLAGYSIVVQGFKQKEWEGQAERNMRVCGVKAPVGVATFYNNTRFKEAAASKHGSGSGLTVFLQCLDSIADAGDATLQVAVGNVHLAGDPSKSASHLTALNSLKKNIGRQDLRVICGDFNSSCAHDSDVGRWFVDEGFSEGPTGKSWAEPGNGQRLDHIFHTRSLEVAAASGDLSLEEIASGLPCTSCPSDHAPVMMLFGAAVRGRCPW